jgi:hypothetical protein
MRIGGSKPTMPTPIMSADWRCPEGIDPWIFWPGAVLVRFHW